MLGPWGLLILLGMSVERELVWDVFFIIMPFFVWCSQDSTTSAMHSCRYGRFISCRMYEAAAIVVATGEHERGNIPGIPRLTTSRPEHIRALFQQKSRKIIRVDRWLGWVPDRWSSYPLYLREASKRSRWLGVDRLLGEWSIPRDSQAGWEDLAGRMEARHRAEGTGEYEPREWCLGGEEFRRELLAQVSERATPQDGGEEVRQSARAKAQRIAQEASDALGWAAPDLQGRHKSAPQQVRIAARLRRETTMTLEWIADRLCLGAATHFASLLQRQSQKGPSSEETLF